MQLSLSALSLRLSEQQLRDMSCLNEYIHRLQARRSGYVVVSFSNERPVRPIGSTPTSARDAWQLALRRVKAEQLRQRGWTLFPGYIESRRRRRLRYVELYKRSLVPKSSSALDDAETRVRSLLTPTLMSIEQPVGYGEQRGDLPTERLRT